jgi:hypothetical protein
MSIFQSPNLLPTLATELVVMSRCSCASSRNSRSPRRAPAKSRPATAATGREMSGLELWTGATADGT